MFPAQSESSPVIDNVKIVLASKTLSKVNIIDLYINSTGSTITGLPTLLSTE